MKEGKETYGRYRGSKHRIIICFVGIMGLLLCIRLFWLTVVQQERWQGYADDVSLRAVYETAPRGDILDRNGRILATSKAVYSINISRVDLTVEAALESADKVMELLNDQGEDISVTQEEVRRILEEKGYTAYLPVVLAEDVSTKTAKIVEKSGWPGIQVSVNHVRSYPQGALASHVLGYLGRISEEEEAQYSETNGYRADSLIGKDGIEKVAQQQLKGTDGISSLQVDSVGNVTRLLQKTKSMKGQDVTLTLDLSLQKVTEEALEQAIDQAACGGTFQSQYGDYPMTYAKNAAVGAAVVLDVKTGQVLSMASSPDYDPNDFAVAISEKKWESLQSENPEDPLSPSPLYNVAAMSSVQPGSTFKPITALAALSCGLDGDRKLYDDGYVSLGGRSFGCFLWNEKEEKHGYLDLEGALAVSCNYYFFDIGSGRDFATGNSLGYERAITNEIILRHGKNMGLGKKTGIEIGESAGTIPSEQLKNRGVKENLRNFLLAEEETYFHKQLLQDRNGLREKIEKIVNWADKDLTLKEIIGKLNSSGWIRSEKVESLARICKYTYFDQMGWSLGDTFNLSIGQGDHAYTTLQMAGYMATLGNRGARNQVSLILGQENENTEKTGVAEIVKEQDYRCVINGMTQVTQSREGSLYSLFSQFPYTVAAKTGTAQRSGKIPTGNERDYLKRHLHLIAPGITFSQVEQEAKRLMDTYPDLYQKEDTALRRAIINLSTQTISTEDIDRYKESYDSFAWTVALAPAEDPEIAVAVMLVQGKTSSNAAPIVREIIGKYGEFSKWEKSF